MENSQTHFDFEFNDENIFKEEEFIAKLDINNLLIFCGL